MQKFTSFQLTFNMVTILKRSASTVSIQIGVFTMSTTGMCQPYVPCQAAAAPGPAVTLLGWRTARRLLSVGRTRSGA